MVLGVYSLDVVIACETRMNQSLLPTDSVLSLPLPPPQGRWGGWGDLENSSPPPPPPQQGCKEQRHGGASTRFLFLLFL